MCSTYLIGGKHCETGADLIAAFGEDCARWLNRLYDNEAKIPADDVAKSCLCHLDRERLEKMTGKQWVYCGENDAYLPTPPKENEK